jgi:hypothetical protein
MGGSSGGGSTGGGSTGGGSTGDGATAGNGGTTGGATGGTNGGTTTASAGSQSTGGGAAGLSASTVPIQVALGATVVTSDRQVVGMIEDVRPATQGKFVATIRMNVAFGAGPRTIQINMPVPKSATDSIRLGFTKSGLLRQIQS